MNVNLVPSQMKIMEPEELNNVLIEKYVRAIPTSIDTISDLTNAGRLLGELTNEYAFLVSMLASFKIWVKQEKTSGDKDEYADMVMRRDSVSAVVDIVKQQYNALSRMVTIKKEINEELKMNDNWSFEERQ